MCILYAVTRRLFLNDVQVSDDRRVSRPDCYEYMQAKHSGVLIAIRETGELRTETEELSASAGKLTRLRQRQECRVMQRS